MPLRKKAVAEIKAEIERLESARIGCTDTRILKVIEFRIEERRLQLADLNRPHLKDSKSSEIVSPKSIDNPTFKDLSTLQRAV